MKKVLLLCVSLMLFSCSHESEINEKNQDLTKTSQAINYSDPIRVKLINNTSTQFHLGLIVKPRYFDAGTATLHDPEGFMPSGFPVLNIVQPGQVKNYIYSYAYPFKDILNEANVGGNIDYWNVIERYLIASIVVKHPITGNTFVLSPFDVLYDSSTSTNLVGNIFTNYNLNSPWGDEVFYRDGPHYHTETIGANLYQDFKLTLNTTTDELVLEIVEY